MKPETRLLFAFTQDEPRNGDVGADNIVKDDRDQLGQQVPAPDSRFGRLKRSHRHAQPRAQQPFRR